MQIYLHGWYYWPKINEWRRFAESWTQAANTIDAIEEALPKDSYDFDYDGDHRDASVYLRFDDFLIPTIIPILINIGLNKSADIESVKLLTAFLLYPFKEQWGGNFSLYDEKGKYSPEKVSQEDLETVYEELRYEWKDSHPEFLDFYHIPPETFEEYNQNEKIDLPESGGP